MFIEKFIRDVNNAMRDPERSLQERLFLRLNIISEIVVFIAYVVDIYMKESLAEIITITMTLILIPVISYTCMYKNKLRFAIRLIGTGLVFVILPSLFFFGGGLKGGGVLWVIYSFLYVGLFLTGSLRKFFIVVLMFLSVVFYAVDYFWPNIAFEHSREMYYIDSFISLVLIGVVGYVMTRAQNNIFWEENARAKKETERAENLSLAQNRFFSSMSHEIRTPINSILGLNELILRDEAASDEIVKDALGIQGSGKMLLSLINDLLDFSKVEAGSMDIVSVDYKVVDMISEVVNMIWIRAKEKGLIFNVTVDPTVPSVLYGDEVRIKQVIVNLLNNAVKYTNSGSIELHIESNEENDEETILSISVTDTGMGIKKESIPYLFDTFKRVDEEKTRYIEGTGLGLSIVKQLVELMGGSITVNSVYGEGTTFNVVLAQKISDSAAIGELNIHSQNTGRGARYECSFKAPEARVLIVDDNEMNLEVETKLLVPTEMVIDKAMTGKDALELTLKRSYDVILMDHLMPEMDGIETLSNIREQVGGLNRSTPVIVLTANAGSANRDLYSRSGFDGYLVKPISGDVLEKMIIKHITPNKLILSGKVVSMNKDINASVGYSGKVPVIVASTSMCDLPDVIVNKLRIPILPFLIKTEEGVFKDGVQMDSDELIRYIHSGKNAVSSPPDASSYTEFFASVLKKAHHLIYISIATSMSDDYMRAVDAAKSFDNVTVINSGCISSTTGILVLIAHKLAQQNLPVADIVKELDKAKNRLRCSFVIDDTEFMYKKGLISSRVHRMARSINLHPSIRFKDGRSYIGGVWMGKTPRAYKRYIRKAFPRNVNPDNEVVFITYADIPQKILYMIKDEVCKYAHFDHVLFKQASAAISSNCGSGTLGILYFEKSKELYNIATYIDEHYNDNNYSDDFYRRVVNVAEANIGVGSAFKSLDNIEGIDVETAIRNTGSESAFETVLKIFYDSIPSKCEEINSYYAKKDWKNYTISVHSLKSSAILIGALELGEMARLLERAGKEKDIDYIDDHHAELMEEYENYRYYLAGLYVNEAPKNDVAKTFIEERELHKLYDRLKTAADEMDCDAVDDVIKELETYDVPEGEIDRINVIKDKADSFDYEGILKALDTM